MPKTTAVILRYFGPILASSSTASELLHFWVSKRFELEFFKMTPPTLSPSTNNQGPLVNPNTTGAPLSTQPDPLGLGQPLQEAVSEILEVDLNAGNTNGTGAGFSTNKPEQQVLADLGSSTQPGVDTKTETSASAQIVSAIPEAKVQLSNKEKARQKEEAVKSFCLALTQDANADEETSTRAKQFLESKETKDKVDRDLEALYARIESLKVEQAEANKRVKDQAKVMTAEKKTIDLGFSRIKAPISEAEMEHLCRGNFLSAGGRQEADEKDAKLDLTPAEWVTKHLGKGARTRQGKKLEAESSLDKRLEQIFLEFLSAFSAHFAEVKEWIRKLNGSVNEMILHHNKSIDSKLIEFQKPSYARAAAAAADPMDQKKVVRIATKEIEKQLQARQLADSKHAQEREKTVRQILGVRIPEVTTSRPTTNKSELAKLEAEHFVNFTNNLLQGQRKKGNKKFVQLNQLESIYRVEWPRGHKGIDLGWDRRLHVTFKPGCEQVVFDIIQAQNWMCALRNREIAEGAATEKDRIHRYLQIQLTDLQRKEHAKLQSWCHRTNAANRENDANCKLWFVFFRDDGTPFKKLITDKHPQRITELEHHWKQYREGGPKHPKRRNRNPLNDNLATSNLDNGVHQPNDGDRFDHNTFQKVSRRKTKNVRVTAEEHLLIMEARLRRQGISEDASITKTLPDAPPHSRDLSSLGANGSGPMPALHAVPMAPMLTPVMTTTPLPNSASDQVHNKAADNALPKIDESASSAVVNPSTAE